MPERGQRGRGVSDSIGVESFVVDLPVSARFQEKGQEVVTVKGISIRREALVVMRLNVFLKFFVENFISRTHELFAEVLHRGGQHLNSIRLSELREIFNAFSQNRVSTKCAGSVQFGEKCAGSVFFSKFMKP